MSLELDHDWEDSDEELEPLGLSVTESVEDTTPDANKARSFKPPKPKHSWRAEHFTTFPWIQYNPESMEATCKYLRCIMHLLSPSVLTCSKWQYPNLQSRLFLQHEESKRHRNQGRSVLPKNQPSLQLSQVSDISDDAIWSRINCVWWLAKEDVAIRKFESHLESTMVNKGLQPPTAYKNEHMAWDIVELLNRHFRQKLKRRLQKSPYFGITADETTDKSVDQQLIVYIKYLDEIDGNLKPVVDFLGMVSPASGSAEDIKVI